jgi:hypothetical protein
MKYGIKDDSVSGLFDNPLYVTSRVLNIQLSRENCRCIASLSEFPVGAVGFENQIVRVPALVAPVSYLLKYRFHPVWVSGCCVRGLNPWLLSAGTKVHNLCFQNIRSTRCMVCRVIRVEEHLIRCQWRMIAANLDQWNCSGVFMLESADSGSDPLLRQHLGLDLVAHCYKDLELQV